jgi:hypothetical protein
MDSSDTENLQMDLKRLGEWAVEIETMINLGESKAVSFTKANISHIN